MNICESIKLSVHTGEIMQPALYREQQKRKSAKRHNSDFFTFLYGCFQKNAGAALVHVKAAPAYSIAGLAFIASDMSRLQLR